ncbi:MAG: hypothetical protein II938_00215 [Alphaproteobacteria bacterium]|nr:hypothetical protein [Alphaproteobacteria bacterium]
MKKLFKNIFTVSYLKNDGARRLCVVLGILIALVPTWAFLTKVHVSENTTLRHAVVSAPEKQQRFVFEHYPYKCNFCDLETDFERWRATFGSWKHVNDVLHADCSKLRNPGSCGSEQKYLAQKISVSYYNFGAFVFLLYALLLFYVPFVLACAVQWIVFGFKQKEQSQKKKK